VPDDDDNNNNAKPLQHRAWTDVFAMNMPMPVRFPARPYTPSGPGSHPWFFCD
jgi:hypothetical protein